MTARPVPKHHWRAYGDDLLPSGKQALNEPFRAFPSWSLRITCDRCGKDRMFSETHAAQGDMLIRDILKPSGPPSRAPATASIRSRRATCCYCRSGSRTGDAAAVATCR
jgi:hypothetical protein